MPISAIIDRKMKTLRQTRRPAAPPFRTMSSAAPRARPASRGSSARRGRACGTCGPPRAAARARRRAKMVAQEQGPLDRHAPARPVEEPLRGRAVARPERAVVEMERERAHGVALDEELVRLAADGRRAHLLEERARERVEA